MVYDIQRPASVIIVIASAAKQRHPILEPCTLNLEPQPFYSSVIFTSTPSSCFFMTEFLQV
jgi:hypothetical protein